MNWNIAFILLRAWTLHNMCNWPEPLFCMAFYCNEMSIAISMLSCVMGNGQELYMYGHKLPLFGSFVIGNGHKQVLYVVTLIF